MPVPDKPKIYHIVHVDRLQSIIKRGLLCDAEIVQRPMPGTAIGVNTIKQRRLEKPLKTYPDLFVGACVPFYFCPRSVMLYVIYCANHPELTYRGGQGPIVHLEADLRQTVAWAKENQLRWAFTLSNAGASYSEDWCDLEGLDEIDWDAVQARRWQGPKKDGKQAEFLVERRFPWQLILRIGVKSWQIYQSVLMAVANAEHKPSVEVKPDWYY